jgi:hypothetical protein
MSVRLFETDGFVIDQYVGPNPQKDERVTRARYQFGALQDGRWMWFTISDEQWDKLCDWIRL